MTLLKNAMAKHPKAKGFLIDGYPREVEQAKEFEKQVRWAGGRYWNTKVAYFAILAPIKHEMAWFHLYSQNEIINPISRNQVQESFIFYVMYPFFILYCIFSNNHWLYKREDHFFREFKQDIFWCIAFDLPCSNSTVYILL